MKYVKAQDVLPEEIIEILQKYVDGKYLYIPRKNENQKAWGENSGIRKSLNARNTEIFKKYKDGTSINTLAKEYFLSEKSIADICKKCQSRLMRVPSFCPVPKWFQDPCHSLPRYRVLKIQVYLFCTMADRWTDLSSDLP